MSIPQDSLSGIKALTFSAGEKLAVNSGFTMSDGTKTSYTRDTSGRIHGLVTMATPEGKLIRTLWQNGIPDGKTEITEEKKKTTYMQKDYKQIGPKVVVYEDETKVTYPFDDQGKITGPASIEHPEGSHQELSFVDGVPQGKSILSTSKASITFYYKEDGQPRWGGEIKKVNDTSGRTLPSPEFHLGFKRADEYYRFYLDRLSDQPQSEKPQSRLGRV